MTVAFMLVLSSGILHAIWNMFAKNSRSKNAFLWHCQWVSIALFLPWIVRDLIRLEWALAGAACLALSMIVHGAYTILLAKAYTIGDLSQAYPIMRGTSPLLVPIVGVFVLGEPLSIIAWGGIGVVLLGIIMLSELKRGRADSSRVLLYGFAVGVCISTYIIIDKIALNYVSYFVLNAATNVGNLLVLSFLLLGKSQLGEEWRLNKKTIAVSGFIAPGGYLLFLFALTLAPVSALAPMREIGTAIGAMLGIWLLKEKGGSRRITAAAFITIGVIIIGIYH